MPQGSAMDEGVAAKVRSTKLENDLLVAQA
jgi:hypothetical protein